MRWLAGLLLGVQLFCYCQQEQLSLHRPAHVPTSPGMAVVLQSTY